jgi:hypothetical protein
MSDEDKPHLMVLDASDVEPMEDVDEGLLTELQTLLGASSLTIRSCLATLCHAMAVGITASEDEESQTAVMAAVITTIVNAVPLYAAERRKMKEEEGDQGKPVHDRRH